MDLTRSHLFLPPGAITAATIPICCGPWHIGAAGHFVTFYMCQEYWPLLDPLEDALLDPTRIQRKLHRALRESLTFRNLPIPPLPEYRQLPKIAIQWDSPRPLWSCGTFAMSTTLHLLLGGIPPPTPSLPNLSHGNMCCPYTEPFSNGSYWASPLTSGLGAASIRVSFLPRGHAHALIIASASQPQSYD